MGNHFELPPEVDALFPSHGWTVGITGIRQLRMPIVRYFQMGHPFYERYRKLGLSGMWLQCHSPTRTIYRLAVALRDLQDELSNLQPLIERDRFDERGISDDGERITKVREGTERIEICLIAAFTLLRRLADDITVTLRPVLFGHPDSAPRELKKAIELAKSGALNRANPICGVDPLANVLLNRTAWLDKLRGNGGIRDVLVHLPHILQVGPQGSKCATDEYFKWEISAHLVRGNPGNIKLVNVFPELRTILAEACLFMDGICGCVDPDGNYDRGDLLFLTGNDRSITEFWSSIDKTGLSPPLP